MEKSGPRHALDTVRLVLLLINKVFLSFVFIRSSFTSMFALDSLFSLFICYFCAVPMRSE